MKDVVALMHNPRLDGLQNYFFRRLAALLEPLEPASSDEQIDLSIGQPMHATPDLLTETLADNGHLWRNYPPVKGTSAFRDAARNWLTRRYRLPDGMLSADEHVLPVAGTKEALFMLSQLVTPEEKAGAKPAVLMPNPFYNVYLGGALLAGAEPVLLSVTAASNHLPDLDQLSPDLLKRTVAFFLCSPANPQGSAASLDYLTKA
ncbi:MAG: aminotransferase class I/II-fold pyridoxal phosphate-dependent enzyme, partial [Geminicoccaceae bacterium]